MPATTAKSAFGAGVRAALPFLLVVVPFSMLFGVVATEAGLPLLQVMVMTSLVIAGAAQFAALQLMLDDASFWLIVGGALAVNLRMAMYSAALVPLIGAAPFWQRACAAYLLFDQPYAMSVARAEDHPEESLASRIGFYFGVAVPIAAFWVAASLAGALIGEAIPEALALDFALPITFLALVAPMLKTIAHLAAAAVSVVVAIALGGLPSGVGLLVAAFAAMLTGALIETAMERRT